MRMLRLPTWVSWCWITLKGVDKAYGMRRLAEVTGIALDDMLFIGDRLDPEGNDYPVKALGVPCHAVADWQETEIGRAHV